MAIDLQNYQDVWRTAQNQVGTTTQGTVNYGLGDEFGDVWTPTQINDPAYLDQLFGLKYSGRRGNVNPYFDPAIRTQLQNFAAQHGVAAEDVDKAALDYFQYHLSQYGQPYSEASSPNIVADEILKQLSKNMGGSYTGMDQSTHDYYAGLAQNYQERAKASDRANWGRDPFGSIIATNLNSFGNTIDNLSHNPEVLAETQGTGGFAGATPAGARFNNWLNDQAGGGVGGGSGDHFKPLVDQWGDVNTEENMKDAAVNQGFDPSGTAMWTQLARMIFGPGAINAGTSAAASGISSGLEGLGVGTGVANTAAPIISKGAVAGTQAYGGGGNSADLWQRIMMGSLNGINNNPTATQANGNMDTSGFDNVDWGNNMADDMNFSYDPGGANYTSDPSYFDFGNVGFDPGATSMQNTPTEDSGLFGIDWAKLQTSNPFSGLSMPNISGDMAKFFGNGLLNLYLANRARQDAQAAADRANPLNDPRRQGAQGQANDLLNNPADYLANNPFAQALTAHYRDNVIPANVAKSGNPANVIDKAGSQFVGELSGNYNTLLQQLMTMGGFNQGTGYAGNVYGSGMQSSYPAMAAGLGSAGMFGADLTKSVFGDPTKPATNTMKVMG